MRQEMPRRFRLLHGLQTHPAGSECQYIYGCYFPLTDLVVGDMGGRGTGEPQNVEWLDPPEQSIDLEV